MSLSQLVKCLMRSLAALLSASIVLILSGTSCAAGEDNNATITYDLGTGSITSTQSVVREGSAVRVKINNLNPFLYEAIISFDQQTRFSEQPAAPRPPQPSVSEKEMAAGEPSGRSRNAGDFLSAPRRLRQLMYNDGILATNMPAAASDIMDGLTDARVTLISRDLSRRETASLTDSLREAERLSGLLEGAAYDLIASGVATKDVMVVRVEIKRRADVPASVPTSHQQDKTQIAELEVIGGIRVNWSAGFAFTSLANEVRVLDSTNVVRRDRAQSQASIAPGTLLHVYRKAERLSYGLSFGFGLAESKLAQYFLGVSVLAGRESRGVLTGGMAAGYRKVQEGPYRLGERVPRGTTLSYGDKFDLGWFVAVSYNVVAGK